MPMQEAMQDTSGARRRSGVSRTQTGVSGRRTSIPMHHTDTLSRTGTSRSGDCSPRGDRVASSGSHGRRRSMVIPAMAIQRKPTVNKVPTDFLEGGVSPSDSRRSASSAFPSENRSGAMRSTMHQRAPPVNRQSVEERIIEMTQVRQGSRMHGSFVSHTSSFLSCSSEMAGGRPTRGGLEDPGLGLLAHDRSAHFPDDLEGFQNACVSWEVRSILGPTPGRLPPVASEALGASRSTNPDSMAGTGDVDMTVLQTNSGVARVASHESFGSDVGGF